MNRLLLALIVMIGGKLAFNAPIAFTLILAFWIGTWMWLDRVGQKNKQQP